MLLCPQNTLPPTFISEWKLKKFFPETSRTSTQDASADPCYCVFFCAETDFRGRIWASTTNR